MLLLMVSLTAEKMVVLVQTDLHFAFWEINSNLCINGFMLPSSFSKFDLPMLLSVIPSRGMNGLLGGKLLCPHFKHY